mmetsp:Transcript_50229/g.119919  ORF Transcript_50229/g.119919 Transcript_50229/m.119919 type:complete len:253 (-) Transcript_50229:64-822(-)
MAALPNFRGYVALGATEHTMEALFANKAKVNDLSIAVQAFAVKHHILRLQVHVDPMMTVESSHTFHDLQHQSQYPGFAKGRSQGLPAKRMLPNSTPRLPSLTPAGWRMDAAIQQIVEVAVVHVGHEDVVRASIVYEVGLSHSAGAVVADAVHLPKDSSLLFGGSRGTSDLQGQVSPVAPTAQDLDLVHRPETPLCQAIGDLEPLPPLRRQLCRIFSRRPCPIHAGRIEGVPPGTDALISGGKKNPCCKRRRR